MNVNGKYLKDESGNIISPVVSTDTTYHGTTKLSTIVNRCMTYTLLFSGGTTGNVTLTSSSANFTMLRIFYYVTMDGAQYKMSVDIHNPHGSNVLLNCFYTESNKKQMMNAYKVMSISGTTISKVRTGTCGVKNSESWVPYYSDGGHVLTIYRVIGINLGI